MHGDTTAVRHLAARLHAQAEEVRTDAQALLAEAVRVPWQGRGAQAMRSSAGRQATAMARTADLHDEAATALVAHAVAVEEVQALIASIEQQAHALVSAARGRLAGLVDAVAGAVDPLDDLLDRFVPPVPGSLDWLDVRLPGLPVVPGLPGLAEVAGLAGAAALAGVAA